MAYRIFISSVQREFAKESDSMYTSPAALTETVWALARHGGVRNCEMEGVAACRMTIRV